jgi:hypothetical protein
MPVACARLASGFARSDHHLCAGFSNLSALEALMNLLSMRLLTWGTAVAALLSAILLAGEDAALPDLSPHPGGRQATPRH